MQLIVIISISKLVAQQPAHYILGENEFKGVKVFDIIQDQQRNYYFATNEGIIKYDFIRFRKMETTGAKSYSFFNFTTNIYGEIFFNNLNNQIYKINKNGCKLFYELTEQESSNLIHLNTDAKGNLLIGCNGIIILNNSGQKISQFFSRKIFISSFRISPNKVIFPVNYTDSFILLDNMKFTKYRFNLGNLNVKKLEILEFFILKNQHYALDIITKKFYIFNPEKMSLIETKITNIFSNNLNARMFIAANSIWSPQAVSGVNYLDSSFTGVVKNFYSSYFISDIYEDSEGNILLGTFDRGVIVINNLKINDVENKFIDETINSIYASEQQVLFLGSNNGKIYIIDNGLKTISSVGIKPILGIYGSIESDYIVFDDGNVKCFNKKTKQIFGLYQVSLKDVAFVSESKFYIGTNIGVMLVDVKNPKTPIITRVKDLSMRIYSLIYLKNKDVLYASTANGLLCIKKGSPIEQIQYMHKNVYSEKLCVSNNLVYALSSEFGILKITETGEVINVKPKINDAKSDWKNLVQFNNMIILQSSHGVYQINTNGDAIRAFHSDFGFVNKKVFAITLMNNFLWVSHEGGVQKINLNQPFNQSSKPHVIIQKVLVNSVEFLTNTNAEFKHFENKVEFVFYSPTLRHRETIKFKYILEGFETDWTELDYTNSKVVFNALPPGSYIFKIKIENLGELSNIANFTFTIKKPVYNQWWFIIFCVAAFLMFIYFLYSYKLKQHKLASLRQNELNVSKLRAIQSQMNPHFIFNALNSIQDLVLQKKEHSAYDSIGKFALLIRKIMHHSEKEFIDIDEELSVLLVYLDMEKLRFKSDFYYSINSNGLEGIEIPPMLIQPYVENAIKHGLMHKIGNKKLEIQMYIEGNKFFCEITDNGIGVEKAEEIKNRQQKLHESFANTALNKRLEILRKHFGEKYGVTIIDQRDEQENCIGTKVIIRAPFKRKF